MNNELCKAPDISYLRRITTDKGIWQHSAGKEPDKAHGYSIDDVARALIAVSELGALFPELNRVSMADTRDLKKLAWVYLSYIEKNQLPSGRFHNFNDADGNALDATGSPDSFGRTVWALAHTCRYGADAKLKDAAKALLMKAAPHFTEGKFLRENAFILLGISHLFAATADSSLQDSARQILAAITGKFTDEPEWKWFEPHLTYSNGMLPYAIFAGAAVRAKSNKKEAEAARKTALAALDFLLAAEMVKGIPAPIGNKGWHVKGNVRAVYDQQPVDAAATILASCAAYRETKDEKYAQAADLWFSWYAGNNMAKAPMLAEGGGVYDGINEPGCIHENMGAESVVSYLLARAEYAQTFCAKKN